MNYLTLPPRNLEVPRERLGSPDPKLVRQTTLPQECTINPTLQSCLTYIPNNEPEKRIPAPYNAFLFSDPTARRHSASEI